MCAVEQDGDSISAALAGFGVKRLVDVADEVEEELEGFVMLILGECGIADTGCLQKMYVLGSVSWLPADARGKSMGMVIVHVVLEKFAYHVGDSRDHTPVGREAVAIILDSARCWGGIIRICVLHH